MDKKCTAIVLSAGKGKRMGTDKPKQYLDLCGKPVLYYCLKAFQESFIDEIVIVASKDDFSYIKKEIVDKYGMTKVIRIVEGGAERYDSVLCGLKAAGVPDLGTTYSDGTDTEGAYEAGDSKYPDYVFIHDGARPFVDDEILMRAYETVEEFGTAIVAVPSKDTVKIVDGGGITIDTPDRSTVWLMQTPQVFVYKKILKAYENMEAGSLTLTGKSRYKEEILTDSYDASKPAGSHTLAGMSRITDDAMVMEHFGSLKVHVSMGSYSNIKITTPEDMIMAEAFINHRSRL